MAQRETDEAISFLKGKGFVHKISREGDETLLNYLMSLSDEEIDSLENVIVKQYKVSDFVEIYNAAIDSLINISSAEDVAALINVTDKYVTAGGHCAPELIERSKTLNPKLQPIAVNAGAKFDQFTDECFINAPSQEEPEHWTCASKLALDLGGVLLIDALDQFGGAATGQIEIMIAGMTCTVAQQMHILDTNGAKELASSFNDVTYSL